MKNLAHSASFESFDKDAPSKPGTKQLGHEGVSTDGAFTPDGKRIVTGSLDKLKRFMTAEAAMISAADARGGAERGVQPDAKRIVTAFDDKSARIWDAATGNCV